MNNIISWFEIPAKDFKRALNFYSEVFRMDIDIFKFKNVPHGVFRTPTSKKIITGAIVETKDMPEKNTGPIIFFNANPDMLEIIERIKENGGEIICSKSLIKNINSEDGTITIPKTLIDNNPGYYAYFYDTEGNKMGLYSNS
ncbi:MAG: VOC family protein [Bacteroidota bacterium]